MLEKIFKRKIENEEVNPLTNEVWTIEDVPETWREKVEELLDEEGESVD